MARVIAVSNLKGGSAKTTTAATVGSEMATRGQRVLLIDIDAQGHLAEVFGVPTGAVGRDLGHVFTRAAELRDVLVPLRPRLDLAPATRHLDEIEPWLINENAREARLSRALRPLLADYDAVLIDCPPAVGIYLINAFVAATEVLVPMTAEFLALTGVASLVDVLGKVRRDLEHDVVIAGVVPTRVNRTVNARGAVDHARAELGPGYRFLTAVPESVAVREAALAGQPVTEYAPDNPAAIAYRAVTQELIDGAP